jgi:hypothetical protein
MHAIRTSLNSLLGARALALPTLAQDGIADYRTHPDALVPATRI